MMPRPQKKSEAPAVEFVPECDHRVLDVMWQDDMKRMVVRRECSLCGKAWEPMPQADTIKRRLGARF